jgi:hypothetical protein|tara:strand:- start:2026 stop:2361 length:336 start_codon:yes stop_codon:yes gene_type:complete
MAYIANMFAEAGATFSRVITYTDSAGNLVDLTGHTGELQVRATVSSASAILTKVPTLGGALGTVAWTFTAAETATLTAAKYVYAIELTKTADATVTRLVEGALTVSPEVVR